MHGHCTSGLNRRGTLSGFTLIELLMVCAIIGILASMATSNYLDAQVRSKVARVKADMQTMSLAVESYAVDHNRYPIRHHRWERGGAEEESGAITMAHEAPFTEKMYDPDRPFAAVGLRVLTTPIAYIACLPADIFNLPAKALAGGNAFFGFG